MALPSSGDPSFGHLLIPDDYPGGTGGYGGGGGGPILPPGGGGGPGNFIGGRAQSLTGPLPGGYSPAGYYRNRLRPFGMPNQPQRQVQPNASPYAATAAAPGGGYAYGGGGPFGGPAGRPGGSYSPTNLPPGVPGSPAFDPNNPFAGATPTGQLQTGEDIIGYLMRQYAQAGGFGPMGDPRITAMLRERAIQDAGAQQHAARLNLIGRSDVDPSTFGFQSLMGDLNSQGNVAQALNQAQLQQALAAQDWYRNYFAKSNLGLQAANLSKRNEDAQRIWQGGQNPGFDWAGAIGGAGKLATSFF